MFDLKVFFFKKVLTTSNIKINKISRHVKGAVYFSVPLQFADQRPSVFTSTNVAHIDFDISHFMCALNAVDVTSDLYIL